MDWKFHDVKKQLLIFKIGNLYWLNLILKEFLGLSDINRNS